MFQFGLFETEKLKAGVNILQKEEDFVLGIFKVLQGRISTKFDNFKKKT